VTYFCIQQNRRALVLQHPTLNGIDYLEVVDSGPDCGKQLLLTLLKDARGLTLDPSQIVIRGGSAKAQVHAVTVLPGTNTTPRVVTINLDQAGDFSPYELTLVATAATSDPPDGFDPQLSTVQFSFKAGCPAAGDCLPEICCPPEPRLQPDINYLAKDYDTFVQVMRDRLAVIVPGWQETHASDIGVALVELLAYAADHLSYQQDAAGTEAYLGTARSRISLRRHAKLVDYRPGEGSNARTWVYLGLAPTAPASVVVDAGTLLFPRVPGLEPTIRPGTKEQRQLAPSYPLAFATMEKATLFPEQNTIRFYTWSDLNCCLPRGATEATLMDNLTTLQAGMVLIFEEVLGPDTGEARDADPTRRWAVRLTRVQTRDYQNRPLVDPLTTLPVTRVWWAPADALPFPLCLSSTSDAAHGSRQLVDVSVARGNVVPADHGVWQDWEDLGPVPAAPPAPVTRVSCICGDPSPIDPPRPRYFPKLADAPLTFVYPFDGAAPASTLLAPPRVTSPTPQLFVRDDRGEPWTVLDGDLLSTHEADQVVLPEIERDNAVFLRFGDGQYGMAPVAGASFQARYRVGNGAAGNVGRDTLAHVLTPVMGIAEVRNPLPAAGGTEPETMEQIRQRAPFAFRTQLRAVTEDDYGTMAQRDPAIRRARGTLRWTGSWYTAFVSIDAAAEDVPDPSLAAAIMDRLNLLRMAGVDLQVEGAIIVGLRIEMNICVETNHFQTDVRDAIMRVFITGELCNGQRAILNPENFTFGQTISTSPLVAAAQAVEGVSSAVITVFQRMDDPSADGAAQGFLTMGRLEIARCDNDPNRLDRGIFTLHMDGGK
jgi:baseplate J-like protein